MIQLYLVSFYLYVGYIFVNVISNEGHVSSAGLPNKKLQHCILDQYFLCIRFC